MNVEPIIIGKGLALFERNFGKSSPSDPQTSVPEKLNNVIGWWQDGYHQLKNGDPFSNDFLQDETVYAEKIRYELLSNWLETNTAMDFHRVSDGLLRELNNDYTFFEYFCEVMRGYFNEKEMVL